MSPVRRPSPLLKCCGSGKKKDGSKTLCLMPEQKSEKHGPIAIFLKKWLGIEFASRIYIYSLVVGAVSGVGAIIFTYFLELAGFVFIEKLAGFRQVQPDGEVHFSFSFLEAPTYSEHLWLLLLLPALGGLVSGWLVYRFAPEASGHGTDAMIDALHNGKGVIRPVVPIVKAVATILTLGSGGSAGKEGPRRTDWCRIGLLVGHTVEAVACTAAYLIIGRYGRWFGGYLSRAFRGCYY